MCEDCNVTMYTPELAEQFARNGALKLDETRPDWAKEIDINKLDMSSCYACIVGQIQHLNDDAKWDDYVAEYGYNVFAGAAAILVKMEYDEFRNGIAAFINDDDRVDYDAYFGLNLPDFALSINRNHDRDAYWTLLRAAWIKEITLRCQVQTPTT